MTYCTVREIIIIVTKTSCVLPHNCYCGITRKVVSVSNVNSLFVHQFALGFPWKNCSVRMETWGLYDFELREETLDGVANLLHFLGALHTSSSGPCPGWGVSTPWCPLLTLRMARSLFSNLDLRFHSYVWPLTRVQPCLEHEPPVSHRWPCPKPSDPPHTEMKWSWGYGLPFKGIVGGHWHKSVCGMTMWSDCPAPRYAPEWLELMST
jgi:hypothetical protein